MTRRQKCGFSWKRFVICWCPIGNPTRQSYYQLSVTRRVCCWSLVLNLLSPTTRITRISLGGLGTDGKSSHTQHGKSLLFIHLGLRHTDVLDLMSWINTQLVTYQPYHYRSAWVPLGYDEGVTTLRYTDRSASLMYIKQLYLFLRNPLSLTFN